MCEKYIMDDFVISNLNESRNEWSARLVSIFTPLVIEGIRSKYLMTFQNLLARVPKWNSVIIEEERKRIIERSGCTYLEDLITCVHIIQLKVLTCIRVGNKQKKIDISVPKLDHFIHKVYINTARKVYTNVYLFEKHISPLQLQRNNRELETIVQECILMAIRESIRTESIIRAYMDESVEQEEEVTIEKIEEPEQPMVEAKNPGESVIETKEEDVIHKEEDIPSVVPAIKNINNDEVVTRLTFNDIDSVLNEDDVVEKIQAPKTIERLEEISTARALQRRLEEEDDDDDDDRIRIHTDTIDLSGFDVLDEDKSNYVSHDIVLDGVEEL
jgi:hypothetical protein